MKNIQTLIIFGACTWLLSACEEPHRQGDLEIGEVSGAAVGNEEAGASQVAGEAATAGERPDEDEDEDEDERGGEGEIGGDRWRCPPVWPSG